LDLHIISGTELKIIQAIIKYRILMGGAPSTGSSALVNILNRHPDLVAGPETFLFIHPKLYQDWMDNRRYLRRTHPWKGLKSEGWFRFNGALLQNPWYGWSAEALGTLIEQHPTFLSFADAFFLPAIREQKAYGWIEKTPSNVLGFADFLDSFENAFVVHTVRNPYDVVASLMARGYSPFYAAAAWLVNTALGLKSEQHPRSCIIRYESWVATPRQTIGQVLATIGVNKNETMWEVDPPEKDPVQMKGWLQNERGKIGTSSVGRFQRLPVEKQQLIRQLLTHMVIHPEFATRHQLSYTKAREMMSPLGYQWEEETVSRIPNQWYRWLWADRFLRLAKGYRTGWQYPVRFS
jgi:hypothetical protein